MKEIMDDSAGLNLLRSDSNLADDMRLLANSNNWDFSCHNAKAAISYVFGDSILPVYYDEDETFSKRNIERKFEEEFEEYGSDIMIMYPNPATDEVVANILLDSALTNAHIEVYSLTGRRVQSIYLLENQHEVRLSVGNLQSGVYIYMLKIGDELVSRKKLTVIR